MALRTRWTFSLSRFAVIMIGVSMAGCMVGVQPAFSHPELSHEDPHIANLHIQRGFSPPLSKLPPVFSSSTGSPPDVVVGEPQTTRAKYIVATLAYEQAQAVGEPVRASDLDYDETAFLHAADPAGLTVVGHGSSGIELFWRHDGRTQGLTPASYRIYRRLNGGPMVLLGSAGDSRTWSSFVDHVFSPGWMVCYTVTTVGTDGQERAYSREQCKVLTVTPEPRHAKYASVTVSNKSCPSSDCPPDDPNCISQLRAACENPSVAATGCFCNVTYDVRAEFGGSYVADAQLEVWGYTPGPLNDETPHNTSCPDGWSVDFPNQCRMKFRKLDTITLTKAQNVFTGTVIRREPLIYSYWYRDDRPTEMMVFRIKAANGSLLYPRQGLGFLTLQVNNRIRDRLWTGLNMNPASLSWAQAIVSAAQQLRGQGYNTVFLDEWRPLKPSIEVWVGGNHEAPALEYPYPPGYSTNDPGFVDPWTTGLVTLASNLRQLDAQSRPPGAAAMHWIGNTISAAVGSDTLALIDQREQERAIGGLDATMFEACIVSGKVKQLDAAWLAHIQRIERIGDLGKQVICHASPPCGKDQLPTKGSAIDKSLRLFSLASFLMAGHQNLAVFGHWEIDPTARTPAYPSWVLNDFVEYHTALGAPVADRVKMGSCWFREYSNGAVAVNPTASNCSIKMDEDRYPVQLINPLLRSKNPHDPGDAQLGQKVQKQSDLVLLPGTGAILLKPGVPAPQFPRSYFSNVDRANFNGDGYNDVFTYSSLNGAISGRYGQPRDGLRAVALDTWSLGHTLVPGDYNGDGRTDLFIYAATGGIEIWYGQASDGLRYAPTTIDRWNVGHTLVPGDYNGDGRTDMFIYAADGGIEIRYGQARDGLRYAPSTIDRWNIGHKLVPGDYNGDGRTDMFIYASTGGIEIRYGQATDGLRYAPTTIDRWNVGHKLVPGDYNGDGRTDLFIYATSGGVEIRYGQATEGLRYAPSTIDQWSVGHMLRPSDFNGDGFTDLLIYATTGSVEIRYGQPTDGLRYSAQSQALWSVGLTVIAGPNPSY